MNIDMHFGSEPPIPDTTSYHVSKFMKYVHFVTFRNTSFHVGTSPEPGYLQIYMPTSSEVNAESSNVLSLPDLTRQIGDLPPK